MNTGLMMVNIDLRHQYGISVAEAQTFLLARRPKRRGARRNHCIRRVPPLNLNVPKALCKRTDNSPNCWMLHVVSVCTPCCMLFDVVQSCCAKFETGQTFQPTHPTFLLFRDRRGVTQQCRIRLHSSSNIVGTTHAHYTCGLQSLMGCILPMMHCRSQHCWELLHLFALHCQHERNNSQRCWPNYAGSCCVRLHVA